MKKYLFLPFFVLIFFSGCAEQEENIYIDNSNLSNQNGNNHFSSNNTVSSKTVIKLKPYKVLGRWYYPRKVNIGETFRGISSWYGPNFHGKLTANGEIYNMYDYTAANKIMPMNTKIRVTNLNNGKSVIVRINDRGPFVNDRILDLSYIAGKKIGLDKTGIAPIEIEVLATPHKFQKKLKKDNTKIQKNGKIKIQIGAFKNISGAKIFKQEFSSFKKKTFINKIDDKYKVFIGNFNSYEEANNFKNRNNIKGFIIK